MGLFPRCSKCPKMSDSGYRDLAFAALGSFGLEMGAFTLFVLLRMQEMPRIRHHIGHKTKSVSLVLVSAFFSLSGGRVFNLMMFSWRRWHARSCYAPGGARRPWTL